MKLKPVFAAISILMGMLGLAACGQSRDQVVYQYPETAVLFPLVKAGRVSAAPRMPENTVRSAGYPSPRTTLAGPAPAER
ncbi:MAG: hypothetical protein ACLU9Q_13575 [Marvinbryantia sp.]|uniref:hypothetical protein n=1 Tax=Marvinbryantia sp. TaxID=2496532 RepID=UPI00399AD146